jgi:hypothetical protein
MLDAGGSPVEDPKDDGDKDETRVVRAIKIKGRGGGFAVNPTQLCPSTSTRSVTPLLVLGAWIDYTWFLQMHLSSCVSHEGCKLAGA